MKHPYNIPHYPLSEDFTTNAGSYYEDLARKNALMKHLAMRIWEYDKELSKRFELWDKMLQDGLGEAVRNELQEWYDNGKLRSLLEEIFDDKMNRSEFEAFADQVTLQVTDLEKIVKLDTYHNFDNFLDHHTFIGRIPTRINGELDFIQSVVFNYARNEFYVARQINGGTNVKISRYDATTYQIKDQKQFNKSGGAYQEGLPYYINSSGDLCFIVRTSYDLSAAIFNYTQNTLGSQIQLNGGSKISSDPTGRYLVTQFGDAARTEGVYIYDMQSVIDGSPQMLRKVKFDNEIIHGEKVQAIQLINNKLIVARGAGNPVLTAVNLNGVTVNNHYLDKKSLGDAVLKQYPDAGFNSTSVEYENEGVSFTLRNGRYYPVVAHVFGGGNGFTYLAVAGDPVDEKISSRLPQMEVRDTLQWKDIPLNDGFTAYGPDVVPQFAKDDSGFVHLRGAVTHAYLGPTPDISIAMLPFPYLPSTNTFHLGMATGEADKISKLQVRSDGNLLLWSTNVTNESATQFTTLDGIRYYSEGREW